MFVEIGIRFIAINQIESINWFLTDGAKGCRIELVSGMGFDATESAQEIVAKIEAAQIAFAVRIGNASTQASRDQLAEVLRHA